MKKAGLVEARRDGKWMHCRLKKLEGGREKNFVEILRHLEKEIVIGKDIKRLNQIQCCPSRYGIPAVKLKVNRCALQTASQQTRHATGTKK